MKKLIWLPVTIAAVALSIVLGLYLGGGPDALQRRPGPPAGSGEPGAAAGGSLPADPASPAGPASPATGDPQNQRPRLPAIQFRIDPTEPVAGEAATFADATETGPGNSLLVSEWRVEGPGLDTAVLLNGPAADYTFPEAGFYRVAHRLQLKEGGLTDWVTQVVSVAQGTSGDDAPSGQRLEPQIISDATGAIDLWVEDGLARFRINSAPLDEAQGGLVENLRATVTYAAEESASIGPGSYRMDIPLGLGHVATEIRTFAIQGKLPGGRQLELSFNVNP